MASAATIKTTVNRIISALRFCQFDCLFATGSFTTGSLLVSLAMGVVRGRASPVSSDVIVGVRLWISAEVRGESLLILFAA